MYFPTQKPTKDRQKQRGDYQILQAHGRIHSITRTSTSRLKIIGIKSISSFPKSGSRNGRNTSTTATLSKGPTLTWPSSWRTCSPWMRTKRSCSMRIRYWSTTRRTTRSTCSSWRPTSSTSSRFSTARFSSCLTKNINQKLRLSEKLIRSIIKNRSKSICWLSTAR